MKVLIISGGDSSERKISFISARQVKKALLSQGYSVKIYDLRLGYHNLTEVAKKFDLIFPMLHGEEGEGGRLHEHLLKLGKPFVGGHPDNFKKGWYKLPFKKFCEENNIPTSPWTTISSKDEIIKFGIPCVLKTSNGGSSREVAFIKSLKDLKTKRVQNILNSGEEIFAERLINGIEVTVGILGDKPLPVLEIIPPKGKWFDYKNKYSGESREIPFAPSVPIKIQQQIQSLGLKIHQQLKLGHYSRIDVIVDGEKLNFLEVNTIPGFTSESLFPKAAKAAGLDFSKLVQELIMLAKTKPII
jgi:D-alanine-D-alanine ligase